jgi:hypothetical protein
MRDEQRRQPALRCVVEHEAAKVLAKLRVELVERLVE